MKCRPIGITFVLSRFAERPDISLKASMYLTQNSRDLVSLLMANDMSSAKVCALISESARGIPFIFLVVVILISKILTAIIDTKGLTISP